jgi:formamidopyrimidine-DNA glycosylase
VDQAILRAQTMVFHLGMSGRWRIDPEEIGKHDHLVIETGRGQVLALNDARRFGSVDLIDTAALDAWPQFAALGPEPLGPGLTAAHLAAAFEHRIAAIKLLLLDQRIVAGLGNIYVCEALHRARIHPEREAGQVSHAALKRLVPEIRTVLDEAIAAGGSTLRDYVRPDGELGYFGRPVERIAQGGRSTFFCGHCQK